MFSHPQSITYRRRVLGAAGFWVSPQSGMVARAAASRKVFMMLLFHAPPGLDGSLRSRRVYQRSLPGKKASRIFADYAFPNEDEARTRYDQAKQVGSVRIRGRISVSGTGPDAVS